MSEKTNVSDMKAFIPLSLHDNHLDPPQVGKETYELFRKSFFSF